MTPDELKIQAWLARRNCVPITRIDDSGRGVRVESDEQLAAERLPEIRLMFTSEQNRTSHWYAKTKGANHAR